MKRLFLSISKGDELRFLGHLDLLRTMERAVVRPGIPVLYSEGFNPHMKLSFDAALGVGVSADPLYMEMRLEKDISCEEVKDRLSPELPKGILIHNIKEVSMSVEKPVTFLNEDVYELEGPLADGKDISSAQGNIAKFNGLSSFIYERVTPKKVRKMDVKPMIISPMKLKIEDNRAYLSFSLIRSQNGSVQPKDIWKLLSESFDLPWTPDEFICSRTGTYRFENGKRKTPFSEDVL